MISRERILRRISIIWVFLLSSLSMALSPVPSESRQLLVVVSKDWQADHGQLYRLERRGDSWRQVGKSIPVKLGKNGLGWGRGLHGFRQGSGPVKREGDGKAPAGIFALSYLFGEGKETGFRYPYRRMSEFHRCVDDSRSRFYNRIVDSRRVPRDFRSSEKMKFASGLYRYGIAVAHNPRNIPGAGSCIFLHIQKPNGRPTVGCTAMKEGDLLSVMHWLDPEKHPLLIQAPRMVIGRLLPANLQLTGLR